MAGELTFLLFALGIIGTGLLAIPVLAGSAAYGVAEAFGWPATLEAKAPDAVGFYGIIAAATIIGFGLGFTSIDPIKMLIWSAVLNGIVAVPIMAVMMVIIAKINLMGRLQDYRKDNEKEKVAFEADTANWFATYCSGWWLKNGKGDIAGLKARGRDGQIIVVKEWQGKAIAQYDDTSIAAFLNSLMQYLQSQKKKNYGDLNGREVRDSLTSLADLYEAYRQMHGPYDR